MWRATIFRMNRKPRTLLEWKQKHPRVNVLAYECNSDQAFGFGELEQVCGFCLASLYFENQPPKICPFCRAPIREARVISDLPEIVNRVYSLASETSVSGSRGNSRKPFLVQ